MDRARAWLRTCQRHHTQCKEPVAVSLPTRVLDLTESPKLRITTTSRTTGMYTALSYCWGNDVQPVTTLENITNRQKGFNLSELPRSIRDAVAVTKGLGLQYLWVDALCIVQDDGDDRQREITSMGSTYKNAHLTIVASSGSSVHKRFSSSEHRSKEC